MEEVKTIFVEGSYSHEIKIPASWEFAPLHEVIELVGGSQPPKSLFKYEPEDGYVRLIQIRDYKSDNHKVYIPRDSARRFVSPDEVMIGRYGPPIFQILRGLEGAYNVALMKAVPVCDVFSKDYLFKYLSNKDLYNYVDSASDRTAGQSGVNKEHLEKYPVAVPPLAEQQQIAQKLDELLAQVDTLKTRLDAIPNILKRFRQSVLAAAVSGRLTDEWRGNCSIDFDSWEKTDLGSVSNVATGKTPKRDQNEYWDNGTIAWLTSSATGNAFTYEAEQFVTGFAVKDCGLKLFQAGTLLLAMYGEGKTRGQVTELKISAACNQACAAITVNESKILRQFVKLVLQENYEETRKVAVGGAQPNLNLNKVREIPVLVPSFEEQTEIVRRVEQLFAYADQIEQRVKDAQARVNHLTQSILAKAFRGELTADWRAQNPELISGENSAAALLERIKVEREAIAKPKRKVKV